MSIVVFLIALFSVPIALLVPKILFKWVNSKKPYNKLLLKVFLMLVSFMFLKISALIPISVNDFVFHVGAEISTFSSLLKIVLYIGILFIIWLYLVSAVVIFYIKVNKLFYIQYNDCVSFSAFVPAILLTVLVTVTAILSSNKIVSPTFHVLSLLACIALYEEFFYREFFRLIENYLQKNTGAEALSIQNIILYSLFFTFNHGAPNFSPYFFWFVFSMVLFWLLKKNGKWYWLIVFHFLWNLSLYVTGVFSYDTLMLGLQSRM